MGFSSKAGQFSRSQLLLDHLIFYSIYGSKNSLLFFLEYGLLHRVLRIRYEFLGDFRAKVVICVVKYGNLNRVLCRQAVSSLRNVLLLLVEPSLLFYLMFNITASKINKYKLLVSGVFYRQCLNRLFIANSCFSYYFQLQLVILTYTQYY